MSIEDTLVMVGAIALIAFIFWRMSRSVANTNKAKKIASLIKNSEIYSIREIASITGIEQSKVMRIVEKEIGNGHDDPNEILNVFKNAHIDHRTMEVIIDPNRNENSLTYKARKAIGSFLDKHISQEPWTCVYCRTSNEAKETVCRSCKASKK